jgi:hypothetical protein
MKFPPTVVKTFAGLLGRVAKIVGDSDNYDRVAKCEKHVQQAGGARISAARSQPYYLDVTHPRAGGAGNVKTTEHSGGRDRDHRRHAQLRSDV